MRIDKWHIPGGGVGEGASGVLGKIGKAGSVHGRIRGNLGGRQHLWE